MHQLMVAGSNNSDNHTCQTTSQDTFIGTKFKYDTVPVFRVTDPEKYLEKWQKRYRKWSSKENLDYIFGMPVYLVLEASREGSCNLFISLPIEKIKCIAETISRLQDYDSIICAVKMFWELGAKKEVHDEIVDSGAV
ncbi:Hypothetical predicted protein [Mytilus galloprovincialis]|nr:Hypothetical predicted protein [Mytilus galloprovincialis]